MIVKKLNKLTVFLGFAGFFVSLYALIVHIQNLMSPGGGTFCDVSATVNCSAVIGSHYGEFASIPLGAYGMAYFAIILSAAFIPKFAQITQKELVKLELGVGLIGLLVVCVLMFISYGIIKIICPTCSIIHIIVILYVILKIFQLFKCRKAYDKISSLTHASVSGQSHVSHLSNETYIRFFAMALCLSIPPLMVGLLSPVLVHYFANKTSQSNQVMPPKSMTENTNAVNTLLKKDMMSFNKSNYIGNGEDYRRGSDTAPVVVQMFSDFGCPHCKTANEALISAQNIVGLDKIVLVYRFYPLSNECNSFVNGKGWYGYNCSLVIAARCAGQQGKFWEFKDWAFSGQDWTDQERAKNFSLEGLKIKSKNLKINTDVFMQCIESHSEDGKIKDDIILANQLNIQGTPMIVVNGVIYQGPLNSQAFVQIFEHELQKGL